MDKIHSSAHPRPAVQIGTEIPSLAKTAYMQIEENARNVIHTDEYAQKYGLRGALVPGSTLLSYVLEMLCNYFEDDWMRHGKIKVSFIGGGAVNGDALTARGKITAITPEGSRLILDLNIWLEKQDGDKILVGQASCIK